MMNCDMHLQHSGLDSPCKGAQCPGAAHPESPGHGREVASMQLLSKKEFTVAEGVPHTFLMSNLR